MAAPFNSISRTLRHNRTVPFLGPLERLFKSLKPSDWFILGILSLLMAGSLLGILASLSSSVSVVIPAPGGTYIEGVTGSPRFINPLLAISDTDRDLVELVFSGLLKKNPDGTLAPDLAASYTVSQDNRTYLFTLKEEATFHDGSPVTAADVVYTVLAAENPDVKSPRRANWEGVEVAAIDEQTVSFTLKAPYAPFLENTTIGILPSHIWNEVSPEEFSFTTLNTEPIGSGPYSVESIKRTGSGVPSEYRLRAFKDGARTPYIESFIMKFYSNAEALRDAMNQGEVDATHSLLPSEITTDMQVAETIFGRVFAVFFNQNKNKLFADGTVRGALDGALDKKAIVDTILDGYGSSIDGPLPPNSIEEVPSASAADRLKNARAMLEDDGWKLGEDGVYAKTVKKESTRLAFSIATASVPEFKRVAELVADSWRAMGAEVELKFFEQNDLNVGVLRPREYDALLFGLVVGRDQDLFAFWHSSQRNDPGLNIALYANIDVDALLEQVRIESDVELRTAKRLEAAEMISDETAAVFLYAPHFVYLMPSRVAGVELGTIVNPSDRFASVDDWYLSTVHVWPLFTKDSPLFDFNLIN